MTDTGRPSATESPRLTAFDARYGPFLALLGVAILIVILIDVFPLPLTATEQRWILLAEIAIYLIFVLEFTVRWWAADDKRRYLRGNWFNLVLLLLPMLRPLLLVRALPAFASSRALSGVAVSHRGLAGLRQLTRGRQLAYVVSLTAIVVLFAAGTVFYLEHAVAGSPITSLGESMWWAATLATTINSNDDPVTSLGRIVALGVRVYAVSIFGYITASIATWLIGRNASAGPVTVSAERAEDHNAALGERTLPNRGVRD